MNLLENVNHIKIKTGEKCRTSRYKQLKIFASSLYLAEVITDTESTNIKHRLEKMYNKQIKLQSRT